MKRILMALLMALLLVSCGQPKPDPKPMEPMPLPSEPAEKPQGEVEKNPSSQSSTYTDNKKNLVAKYGWERELGDIKDIDYKDMGRLDWANSSDIIGEIFIPALDISLNIYGDLTDGNIAAGAVQLYLIDEFGEDNLTLTSHSAPLEWTDKNVLFNHLRYAKVGMKVFVTDMVKVWEYEIKEVAKPGTENDVYMVKSQRSKDEYGGQPILTLMTCLGGQSEHGREFTTAVLTKTYDYTVDGLNQLIDAEKK